MTRHGSSVALRPFGSSTLAVRVTQEHIDNGRACRTLSCPLALATGMHVGIDGLRDLDNIDTAKADADPIGWEVDFWDDPPSPSLLHSRGSRRFVERFDKGLPVHPATFRLRSIP